MATAKVIKLQNGSTPLLPITDSAYVQHKWKEGETGGTTITSVRDALNNVIDRVDALDLVDDDHAYHKISGTSGKMNDTTNSNVVNPYLNVHTNTTDATGASAVRFNGSGTNQTGSKTAYVWVTGNPSTGNIVINATYADTIYNHPTDGANKSVQQNAGGTLSEGKSFKVAQLTINNLGHVTSATDMTYTMPSTFTPSSHTHGYIQNDGTLSSSPSKVVVTDANSKITTSSNITTTELGYLDNARSNIQDQIDTLSTTIASGMHMRGTTTTVPSASTTYMDGDSYVCNGAITIPAGQSMTGVAQTTEKGDMITYIASQKKWAVIQNNIGDYVESIKTTDDNTWIEATPTAYTSGKVTIDIKHIGPGSAVTTYGPAANKTLDLAGSTFAVPKISVDAKGHITSASTVTYTMPTHSNPSITTTKTGSGNVVTYVSANNHALTYYMGITALTAHQDHTFINKAEGSSGNYELKLSKGSSGSGSSVYFTPANGVKLTTTGTNTLKIGGTSVDVVKTVSYTSNIWAVVGKDADINDTWLNNALGSTPSVAYVTSVSSTNESVWDYT